MTKKPLRSRGGSSSPPNKKYTGAAASALQTIQSYKKSKLSPSTSTPILLSESALMDKETNAIYWQDVETTNILSTSLTRPYLTQKGVVHVRATILFAIIWLWIWRRFSHWLCKRYFEQHQQPSENQDVTMAAMATSVSVLSALDKLSSSNLVVQKMLSVLKPILRFALLTLNALLYIRPPPYPRKVIVATLALYLLESYGCSTRRYLSHAMNAPKELTEYLESLRNAQPVVKWKVRCFHYEEREMWKWILSSGGIVRTLVGLVIGKGDDTIATDFTQKRSKPSWMTKKVVTHQAIGNYKFGSCEDYTLATLWKRAQSFSSHDEGAPFSKLALSKLLVLKDKKAREDYFAQQAAFVMLEGRKDVNAEFATSIEVPGFCSKLLAVRPVPHAKHISASLFRLHIYYIFTLLGLSLPYRIWFSKHCDEVRVSVVKETGDSALDEVKEESLLNSETKSSWLRNKLWGQPSISTATIERKNAEELFKKSMQKFSLYEHEPPSKDQNDPNERTSLNATIYLSGDENNQTNQDLEASAIPSDYTSDVVSSDKDSVAVVVADTPLQPEESDSTNVNEDTATPPSHHAP